MFDFWYEVENDRVILTKPFVVEYDYRRIKNTTQSYLVELRHTSSEELVLPYSGGLDSTFLIMCYQDCIKAGTLKENDYEILSFDFQPTVKKDAIKYWFAEKYIHLPVRYEPIYYQTRDFVKFLKTLSCVAAEFGTNVQQYACSLYPNKRFIKSDTGLKLDFKAQSTLVFHYLNPSNVIHLQDYYEYVQSTWIDHIFEAHTCPTDVYQIDPVHLSVSYQYANRFPLFLCYPQIYALYPKRSTLYNGVAIDEVLKRIVSGMLSAQLDYPIFLPNGERVTSVQQTQEFFNRQT